jgi:hypothetical protein
MSTYKLILYPYAGALAALGLSMLLGTAAFGTDLKLWAHWQIELVSRAGTILGITGGFLGMWLSLRSAPKANS